MAERFPTAILEHGEIKMGHTHRTPVPTSIARRLPRKRMYEN
jgi:hypothetical protein